jgi:hypothetical protein
MERVGPVACVRRGGLGQFHGGVAGHGVLVWSVQRYTPDLSLGRHTSPHGLVFHRQRGCLWPALFLFAPDGTARVRGPSTGGRRHGSYPAELGLHLYLSALPGETSSFILIVIGCGMFFYSTPWLLITLATVLGVWTAVAASNGFESGWPHFGFFVFQVALMALVAHHLRLRALAQLVRSRLDNNRHRRDLEETVAELGRAGNACTSFRKGPMRRFFCTGTAGLWT